ncbi:MAG: hypothetical protein RML93_09335 [Anaerolineales bacterium]|nr:hypothetical protein [Anaerolineales bacterium]MDW8447477.1 hypothetical protein [Anaerolineales bacterium]
MSNESFAGETMNRFIHRFLVRAPLRDVAEFHRDTRALRRLTPPPLWVQFHHLEPLAENSIAEFSLWFGPFPVRWRALHTDVHPLHGFTDTQVQGPLRYWKHTHSFQAIDPQTTQITETIEYEYPEGWRGVIARLLYSPFTLRLLFLYRQWVTRLWLERRSPKGEPNS